MYFIKSCRQEAVLQGQSQEQELSRFVRIRRLFFRLAALNGGALGILWLMGVLFGREFYRPYFRHVTENTVGFHALFVYLLLMVVNVALQEPLLRLGIQRWSLQPGARAPKALGVVLAAAVATLFHWPFGWRGMLYAFLLGLLTALFYARTRHLKTLLLWHLQWDWLAVAATILLALTCEGMPRQEYRLAYKGQAVARGELYYRKDWGWVDRSHYQQERLGRLVQQLSERTEPVCEISMTETLLTVFGTERVIPATYVVTEPAALAPGQRWAVAAGICIDFAALAEEYQQGEHPLLGMCLSAWQFDDMPSVLLMCLDTSPTASSKACCEALTQSNPEILNERWRQEGLRWVQRRWDRFDLPPLATEQHRCDLKKIAAAGVFWRRKVGGAKSTKKSAQAAMRRQGTLSLL